VLYAGISEVEASAFGGAVTRLEPYSVPQSKALYAQNIQFLRGEAETRYGHTPKFQLVDGAITSLANWFFVFGGTPVSVIAYYAPSVGVRVLNQLGPTLNTIMTVTGAAGAMLIPNAERLYVAFYDSTGRLGAAGGRVYGWDLGDDPLFAAPIQNAVTAVETGPGFCTAGDHRIGYLTTTRNGYTGTLQPVDISGVFTPLTFNAAGDSTIQVTISGTLPSYLIGGLIQIVMTTASNPNQYFAVPGATSLPANPTVINVSISDDDLAATGTDVTDHLSILTSSVGGVPPFFPSAIWSYSSRLCYAALTADGFPVVYISDPNDYQFLTLDQHAVSVEGQQQVVAGFSLRGVNYMACTSGFYDNEDNGNVPVTWTPPQRVDGSIGILSATCVYANPSAGYALVASERGFYLFQGGLFPPLPLSWYVDSDWSRINWMVPTQVQIAEDTNIKEFIVIAPLTTTVLAVTGSGPYTVTTSNNPHLYPSGLVVKIDGVSGTPAITVTGDKTFTIPGGAGAPTVGGMIYPQTASHRMKFNYAEGDTPETIGYSIDSFTSYRAAAVAVIRTLSTLLPEVYYAPAANGFLIRKNDGSEANPWRDCDLAGNPAAINCLYETALFPNPKVAGMTVHDYHGAHLDVSGSGLLTLLAKGLRGGIVVTPVASPIALEAAPSKETLVRWFLRNERQSIRFGTNAIDHHFILSLARIYYTDAFAQR